MELQIRTGVLGVSCGSDFSFNLFGRVFRVENHPFFEVFPLDGASSPLFVAELNLAAISNQLSDDVVVQEQRVIQCSVKN